MILTVQAPAKINLTLEILSKRDDGFHELRSIIQTIDLCDTFTFEPADETVFSSGSADWDGEKSLVSKAVSLFRETTGRTDGVKIGVEKRIPMMAGLGGDSSDAAAVLQGLNRLWDAGLSTEHLHAMAETLGSDVPFFLYGGTALLEGRGETVIPLSSVKPMWIVLVVPDIQELPGKTGRLFSALAPEDFTDSEITRRSVDELNSTGVVPEIFNAFENVAYRVIPGLKQVRDDFISVAGTDDVHLAGSGPVLFTLVTEKPVAEKMLEKLGGSGMRAILAKTLSAGKDS